MKKDGKGTGIFNNGDVYRRKLSDFNIVLFKAAHNKCVYLSFTQGMLLGCSVIDIKKVPDFIKDSIKIGNIRDYSILLTQIFDAMKIAKEFSELDSARQ